MNQSFRVLCNSCQELVFTVTVRKMENEMEKDAHNSNIGSGVRGRVLVAILTSGFLSTLGVGLFSFTMPLLTLDDKVSGTWLGSAFAGYYLAKLLVSPVAGEVADRIGAKLVLLTATILGAIVPLVYFVNESLTALYLIQLTLGLVSGLIKPLGLAVLGGSGDKSRLSQWFSWHASAFNFALVISPLVGGYLYSVHGLTPVLFGLSLCMGVTACVLIIFLPGDIATRSDDVSKQHEKTNKFQAASLFLAIGGRTLGVGLMAAFYPILLTSTLGRSGIVVGAVFAVPTFMVCLGLPVISHVFKGKSQYLTVVVGMLISAGALFALGACRELWQFVIFGGLMGLGAAISLPSAMAFASGLSPYQGRVFGLAHLAAGIGFLFGPLLGGFIIQNYHEVGIALQTAALIGACVCMPHFYFTLRKQFNWGKMFSLGATATCLLLLALFGSLHLLPKSGTIISAEAGLYKYSDVAMGTVVNLTLKAESQKAADDAARKVLSAMRAVQRDYDYRDPNGSIGRINRGAGKHWVTPTDRAYALLQRTLVFSEQTEGVFDPTIGALTASPLYYVLDEAIAKSRKDLVDYRMVEVRESDRSIRLAGEGMALDLGGIAKGAIIDMAVSLLRSQSVAAGVVEAGGDFYCFGDRDWTVGIRHPRADEVYATITVREKGVCGSGDYQQFVTTEKGGQSIIQHHIIDPSDMISADKSAGVTVVADSAEKADMLATALFIMGPSKGKLFMEKQYPDAGAMWFKPDLSVVATDTFPQ